MTEHFTREEAATLAKAAGFEVRRGLGLRESVPEDVFARGLINEEVTVLCNAAVTAIDKKREAQGAVARVDGYYGGRCVITPLNTAAILPTGMALYTHALPAQPAEPAKDAGLVADGWKPIETAPKDGTMFLAYVSAVKYKENDDGSTTEFDVSEIDFCQWTSIAHIEGTSPSDGYWDNMMSQIGDSYGVTHWMPLPASPKIGGV